MMSLPIHGLSSSLSSSLSSLLYFFLPGLHKLDRRLSDVVAVVVVV